MSPQKAKIQRDKDPVRTWDQIIEDFNYTEQQMIINAHMTPEEFENTDYYRLVEIMSAKPRDKRPKTLEELMDSVGDGRKGG